MDSSDSRRARPSRAGWRRPWPRPVSAPRRTPRGERTGACTRGCRSSALAPGRRCPLTRCARRSTGSLPERSGRWRAGGRTPPFTPSGERRARSTGTASRSEAASPRSPGARTAGIRSSTRACWTARRPRPSAWRSCSAAPRASATSGRSTRRPAPASRGGSTRRSWCPWRGSRASSRLASAATRSAATRCATWWAARRRSRAAPSPSRSGRTRSAREVPGLKAPPEGLVLWSVAYPEALDPFTREERARAEGLPPGPPFST